MENKEDNKKSFRILTKGYGYGKWLLVFMILSIIFSLYEKGIKPHSLSALMSFFITMISIVLSTGVFYFLTLWIMKLIRHRGKIKRPESKKAKRIVNIIFAILLLMMFLSVIITILKVSSTKTLLKEVPEKSSIPLKPKINNQDTSLLIEQCKAKAKTEANQEKERQQDNFISENYQEILDTHCNNKGYPDDFAVECASSMMDSIVKDYNEKWSIFYDKFYSECLNN